MLTRNADTLHWGFALEFSTLYLTNRFTPGKLPKREPVNQLVPLIEFAFDSPRGEKTSATMNPGLSYVTTTWQLAAEAIVPLNKEAGRSVGARAQLLLFLRRADTVAVRETSAEPITGRDLPQGDKNAAASPPVVLAARFACTSLWSVTVRGRAPTDAAAAPAHRPLVHAPLHRLSARHAGRHRLRRRERAEPDIAPNPPPLPSVALGALRRSGRGSGRTLARPDSRPLRPARGCARSGATWLRPSVAGRCCGRAARRSVSICWRRSSTARLSGGRRSVSV